MWRAWFSARTEIILAVGRETSDRACTECRYKAAFIKTLACRRDQNLHMADTGRP